MSQQLLAARTSPSDRLEIDPRGPQFAAGLTSVVLALVLVTAPGTLALGLLGLQAVLFAVGASLGVTHTPYAWVFRRLVRPYLGAPRHLEDAAPPQFAQSLGFAFTIVALVAFLSGATAAGLVVTGLALVAAMLNSAFGLCLGCELYLLATRTGVPALVRNTTHTIT